MKLKIYKNYYVDYRLKQFRSVVNYPAIIEFVDFKSEKGDKLLLAMLKKKLIPEEHLNSIL